MEIHNQFDPTRAAALERLEMFASSAGRNYEARRNTDTGPGTRSNVSMLSPYIRHRLITEEEVLSAVLAKHSFSAAEKFIQEVFWRTYFKGHLETRPLIWSNYQSNVVQQVTGLENNSGRRKAYEQAVGGKTGIDCFDAWVGELLDTGYLHNHTRMWFASIWIFTLRLPWELGADFMYQHLLDGDPASNTLSWRWVGGLHTKGKTYLARPDNIKSYTAGRFSPDGLAREALPLDEPPLPSAKALPAASSHFPTGKVGLLLTEEDMHPESLDHGSAEVMSIAGATRVESRSPLEVSDGVTSFTKSAMKDALTTASRSFVVPATHLTALTSDAIENWARVNAIETVVTAYAPMGPVASGLAEITPQLAAKAIRLVQVRRAFDTAAWPHGTRGFFAMKEKIPKLLRVLGTHQQDNESQLSLFAKAK